MTPARKTLRLLSRTANTSTVSLLRKLLQSEDPVLLRVAVLVTLERGYGSGLEAILESWHRFPPDLQQSIGQLSQKLVLPIRSLLSRVNLAEMPPSDQTVLNALELVEQFELYAASGAVLSLLEQCTGDAATRPESERCGQTLLKLTKRLHEHVARVSPEPGQFYLRDASRVRQELRRLVQLAVDRIGASHSHAATFVEAYLSLSDVGDSRVDELLREGLGEKSHLPEQILTRSAHPGVLALLLGQLQARYPSARQFAVLGLRSDLDFLITWLDSLPNRYSDELRQNLARINALGWLDDPVAILEQLPPRCHAPLMELIGLLSLPQAAIRTISDWMLAHGSAAGRDAARSYFDYLDQDEVKTLLNDSLANPDGEIQAWATRQLRAQHVPGAFELLVERVNDPDERIRSAARDELSGLTLERFQELAPSMPPDQARVLGQLVLTIHPEAEAQLESDLAHPIVKNRIRALHTIFEIGMHEQMFDQLSWLAETEETSVRREIAVAFGESGDPRAIPVLEKLTRDDSYRIAETAREALGTLRQHLGSEFVSPAETTLAPGGKHR